MHLQRELDEKQHLMEKVKEGHQVQIRQIREKYEYENSDLSSKLNSFTDQLESLNLTYKEKNTKLYSMVIQLERVT
jgi:DNA-binding transcriptional regulator YiaG